MNKFTSLNKEKEYYRNTYGALNLSTVEKIIENEQVSIPFLKEYGERKLPQKSNFVAVYDAYFHYHSITEEIAEQLEGNLNSSELLRNHKNDISLLEKHFTKFTDKDLILDHPDVRPEFIETHFEEFDDALFVLKKITLSDSFIESWIPVLDIEKVLVLEATPERIVQKYFAQLTEKEKRKVLNRTFSFEFYKKNKEIINWHHATPYINFTHEEQEELMEYIHWSVFNSRDISPVVLNKYLRFFNFGELPQRFILKESFLEEHYENLSRWDVWKYQRLSESFIRKNQHLVDWSSLEYQTVPEDVLWANKEKIHSVYVETKQVSERINEFLLTKKGVHWRDQYFERYIATRQKFSMDFYLRNDHILDEYDLNQNQLISDEIKEIYNGKMELKRMFG